MKTIINLPNGLFNGKSRPELDFQAQLRLCDTAGYRQIKSVIKRQRFDHQTLRWMLINSRNFEDKLYKALVFYYKQHGFDDALKLLIVGKRLEQNYAAFSDMIIAEYGCEIRYDGHKTVISATAGQVLEVLKCTDEKVRGCFLKFKKLEKLLAECVYVPIEREMIKNQIYYLPCAGVSDWNFGCGLWRPLVNEEKLREKFYQLFPTIEEQKAIWAYGNVKWIELLKDMAILVLDAWENLWNDFDEKLFCGLFRKMLLD